MEPSRPLEYYVAKIELLDAQAARVQADSKMNAAARDAVILAAIKDGYRSVEVARTLGISEGRISQIKSRARQL